MKAYILKMTFEDITPTIWRRVIMPADVTFNRLHQTIQYVTNFQSKMEPYHTFGVKVEDFFITNNESIIEEYKDQPYYGKEVRQPSRIKIDKYIEEQGELIYNYDFGDDWKIRVELESTVEDYYFGYPTLLAGEGIAPPEDVGGPPGYAEFLRVYEDPNNEEHSHIRNWAKQQGYSPFDMTKLNEGLKAVQYKKTEWESIDHDNYVVISDKYRGVEATNLEELPNTDLMIDYAKAFVNLYGAITDLEFLEIYNTQNEQPILSSELREFLTNTKYVNLLEKENVVVIGEVLFHKTLESVEVVSELAKRTNGKPLYVPEKTELLRYADPSYYEETIHHKTIGKMISKDFFGGSTFMVKGEIDQLVSQFSALNANFTAVVQEFFSRFELNDTKQTNEYVQILSLIANTTRMWENRGHTPHELSSQEPQPTQLLPNTVASGTSRVKVGRNQPCPCGSGKKYKRCCGR